jgi:hypothetical protein
LEEFNVGNLVLLRSPCIENTGKFESKWTGPYVVTDKTRHVHTAYQILRAEFWTILGIQKTFAIFSFKSKL